MKKIILSSRNYRLDIPKLIMKGMGWSADKVEVIPNPENNTITLKNNSKKAIGSTGFLLNINEAKWEKNKKEYAKNISQNISPEGRKILYSTNWDEVEDGGYYTIRNGFYALKEFDRLIKNGPKELLDAHKSFKQTQIYYLKGLLKYLEQKGGKKPRWLKPYETKLKNM